MEIKKMSLAAIQGKLSRAEMKNIMAGVGGCGVITTSHNSGSCLSRTGLTQSQAIAYQQQAVTQGIGGDADHVYWCCASCSNYSVCEV